MSQRKRYKRRLSRMIGFKAFVDTDQDIIAWWDSLPPGQRSETLRTIIRDYASGEQTDSVIMRQLDAMRLDMSSQFHAVLQKIGQIGTASVAALPPPADRLSEEEMQQRKRAILKNRW